MISVVVPIFNEEELIRLFHAAVTDAMKRGWRGLGGGLRK